MCARAHPTAKRHQCPVVQELERLILCCHTEIVVRARLQGQCGCRRGCPNCKAPIALPNRELCTCRRDLWIRKRALHICQGVGADEGVWTTRLQSHSQIAHHSPRYALSLHLYVHMFLSIHIHVYLCIYIYLYVYICIYLYVYMYNIRVQKPYMGRARL